MNDDLRADIEEAMRAARRTKRIMDRVHEKMGVVAPQQAQTEKEIFNAAMGVPTEIDISSSIASLAGKLMHHADPEVRKIAAEIERHVRRLEGKG